MTTYNSQPDFDKRGRSYLSAEAVAAILGTSREKLFAWLSVGRALGVRFELLPLLPLAYDELADDEPSRRARSRPPSYRRVQQEGRGSLDDSPPKRSRDLAIANPGRSAGAYNRREDQSTPASTTDTVATTTPISHPFECCEVMIAAMTTPIAMTPAVATSRMSGPSTGSRPARRGIITSGCCATFASSSRGSVVDSSGFMSGSPSPLPGPMDTRAR
jgi:hypothetical protein